MPNTDSIWLRAEPERPRRPAPLTRERIVEAAIALLDADGIEGLTMRRLAQRFNVSATALYWHVRTKEDVLDLAVDEIFRDVGLPEVTADWRADVRALIWGWRDAMLHHPWSVTLIGRPALGPNVLARTEFLQTTLMRGGLTGHALAVTTRLLANYVIGAAATTPVADPGQARRHITADPAAYPTLTASGHLDPDQWDDDDLFASGLNVLLG
ncbi:TetR/AcrR family transcriptional regulator [Paractinoplanes atraurantiacus]|uniref:Regulatory protein, tetR family n=1 Tax=Paractinoplanes atraurantiacus TaxID=1036182 RepID=A0A285JPG3_9ACTN|nr:TetR family transcriptional regulator [Actinoplanes atraurantiacus]SNY62168.1 regulatory protein, tetR family [Actinoplanes atraurantiacus]